jgi:CspA family cold shock protein
LGVFPDGPPGALEEFPGTEIDACCDGRGESFIVEEKYMAIGTVKWFNATKGYGFIQPEDGKADVFLHISAVERAGMQSVGEGQKLSYELETGRNGKTSAVNIRAV